MDDNNNIKYSRPVPPFVRYCSAIIPTAFDDSLSYYEALCAIWKWLQDNLVDVVNNNAAVTDEYIKLVKELEQYVHDYFDNLDVQEEINNKLDDMAEDGTLAEIVAEALNYPQGMSFNLTRIGRKLFNKTSGVSTAFNMQGGCYIGDNLVAYALWDSHDPTTNLNKIVVMNINTGEIVRYADYSFGWCNSIAYYDGKLYIAVRGTNESGVSVNNGVIKILNAETLALIDTVTLSFNVNAIAHGEDGFYVLQESSGNIYLYDNTLSTSTTTIEVEDSNYHQDIYVDDKFIYLLSSRADSSLNLYDLEGNLIRKYNTPRSAGIYQVGEVQFIDRIGNDILIGTQDTTYLNSIAQFFKGNLLKNVTNNHFVHNYAQTLNCDSTADNYNPDGTSSNPFTEIYECNYIDIDNIIIEGNSESYKYIYLTGKVYVRIQNATLSDGGYLQYGKYILNNVTINYSSNSTISSCVYIRNGDFYFNSVTFDGDSNAYLINNGGFCKITFSGCTFSDYTTATFTGSNTTSDITLNGSTNNLPYIPRLYNVAYNLCHKNDLNAWAANEYDWQTDLSADQIQELKDHCTHLIVGVKSINSTDTIEYEYPIRSGDNSTYTIVQSTSSTSSCNIRVCKTNFKISKSKITITSVGVNQVSVSDGVISGSVPTATSSNSNTIMYIKMITRN